MDVCHVTMLCRSVDPIIFEATKSQTDWPKIGRSMSFSFILVHIYGTNHATLSFLLICFFFHSVRSNQITRMSWGS